MKHRTLLIAATSLSLGGGMLFADPPAPTAPQSAPTREEYDQLKQSQDELRQEVLELRKELQEERAARAQTAMPATSQPATGVAVAGAASKAPDQDYATHEDTDELEKEIKALKDNLDLSRPGLSTFHLAGDGHIDFVAQHGSKSTFAAGIAPLILWQPEPHILIETGFDIGIATDDQNDSSTSFDLTLANINFLLNDYINVGGGLFVVPFGVYHRHFDPPWINKFPDDPLPFGDSAIAPSSEVGLFIDGVIPIHSTKVTYDVYVTNGPNLVTNNSDSAGQLNFDDFTDLNNGKAVGGRIGFLPFPNMEMGYSIMGGAVNPDHFKYTDYLVQAVDLNWRLDVAPLNGQIDFRTEWVWSSVNRRTYDADGSQGFGPINFNNDRTGGYAQLCYRPTKADNKIIRNLEFVSRYDMLRSSLDAPSGDHEERLTLGVDYWITPAVVLKTAYEFDDKNTGDNTNGFFMQLGFGL